MKFSLIMPTKGRTAEIAKAFDGFRSQTLQDFEVIVSDQNEDDRVTDVLREINWPGKLTHLRSSGGASSARNAGLALAQGEIITFPDDDCMYFPTLLADVSAFFDQHTEYGILSGRSVSDEGGNAATAHATDAGEIRPLSIYRQSIEFTLFFRRTALGGDLFDPGMGTGCPTPWQSDEAPDLLLRLFSRGVKGYYDPAFAIWHPNVKNDFSPKMTERCYRYACGSGYFLRKHHYPAWFFLKLNLRTLAGVLLGLLTCNFPKAKYFWVRLRGRLRGWTGYKSERRL